ncbi:hypothetical protein PXH78_09305 [Mycolicibacterium smegmatis]|uniref:hypothetical protein n=1 Tax=Mycolicibacterium smegmatis TaxID=1772 RepID=UPI0005D73D22|nr:hypothetical protein [Mycolicibacterium smegmatis]MDF1899064.1 hypothetical protein [Mycolicibacterium smegmatis]MDF1904888.1 hypothetical protein [Mycolicibacterium smegmatis]MDF1918757.1 hypothetical protein [Mycolicibacterium smegmatis]MDF1924052.1 hypothetical protein [Mycolicibacterium smegmatis]UAK53338.1 hypothetical protein K8P01_22360 [Mycolicibacterium smegmatis]
MSRTPHHRSRVQDELERQQREEELIREAARTGNWSKLEALASADLRKARKELS